MEDQFFKNILDETDQMIQISDLNTYEMLYANKTAIEFAGQTGISFEGRQCYDYMMGYSEPCPFCPLKQDAPGQNEGGIEIDNGTGLFLLKMKREQWNGRDVVVEYATDITGLKRLRENHHNEMDGIFASILNVQSVFRINMDRNSCTGTGGSSELAAKLSQIKKADRLIESIAEYLEDNESRSEFLSRFNVESLAAAYHSGKHEIVQEARFYIAEGKAVWSRITALIMKNPGSGDLECILYCVDISQDKLMQSKMVLIEEALKRDTYTGLYTKNTFENLCIEYLSANKNEHFAIIFLDMDHLKRVNDICGHLTGDQAITDIARKIQVHFSNMDVVARFGGDEFAVLVKDISLSTLTEKLDWLLRKARMNYQGVSVTCSIGAVHCEGKADGYYELMKLADRALYRAKECGRDRFYIDHHASAK